MKRPFGARLAESCTRSKHWIAASPKREGALLGLERKLTSIANDRCLRDRTAFLRQANLRNFALERLSRYEAALWRQASQIL
jgi:hypothetical protein